MRLLKVLVFLLVTGGVGLVGYAYLGDLDPDQKTVTIPVDLDAQ